MTLWNHSWNPLSNPKTASWNGSKCDEHKNQVIRIMDANSCLFRLVYLQNLDLSNNNFNYSLILPKIGELSQLRYL